MTRGAALALAAALASGCGVKGPPRPPVTPGETTAPAPGATPAGAPAPSADPAAPPGSTR